MSAEVLHIGLVEVEGILNSKPLRYVSLDVADPEPVTSNFLLMGRQVASHARLCIWTVTCWGGGGGSTARCLPTTSGPIS